VVQVIRETVLMAPQESDHDKVATATDATADSMQMQWFPVNAHEAPEAFVVVAPLPGCPSDAGSIHSASLSATSSGRTSRTH